MLALAKRVLKVLHLPTGPVATDVTNMDLSFDVKTNIKKNVRNRVYAAVKEHTGNQLKKFERAVALAMN